MNAQKLRNNKIAIGSTKPRKDAVQVIENLRTAEFFCLVRAARNWDKSLNDRRDIILTTYENEQSKVCKEFNRIFERRKLFEEKERELHMLESKQAENSENSKSEYVKPQVDINKLVVYKSNVIGTSKLIRIPKKQIIKIIRRKGTTDNSNKQNSVCIDNRLRESFFADCKQTQHFDDTKLYEIMYNEFDKDIYNKWDSIMDNIYKNGLEENNQI